MGTYYLIDYNYEWDEERLFGTSLHLLTMNPGQKDLTMKVTAFFEDREPESFTLPAPAGKCVESNMGKWPVKRGERFALVVETEAPVVCQATIAWNNSLNKYAPGSPVKAPEGLRETAWTYLALDRLSQDWYVSDCVVIHMPDKMYVQEPEWTVLLNPGDKPAQVKLRMLFDEPLEHTVEVPARRLKAVLMDAIVRVNSHYGLQVHSDRPIAAQHERAIYWNDRPDLMAFWSVPCVPGPLR